MYKHLKFNFVLSVWLQIDTICTQTRHRNINKYKQKIIIILIMAIKNPRLIKITDRISFLSFFLFKHSFYCYFYYD